MKKKIIIFLIIGIVLAIILIPIITLAQFDNILVLSKVGKKGSDEGNIVLPKVDDQSLKEADEKERERALAEKEEFFKNTNNVSTIENNQDPKEEIDFSEIDKAAKEAEEIGKKRSEIIDRYYHEEYERICKEFKQEENQLIEIKSKELTDYEKSLYDIVLTILEEKQLSKEEYNLLKDYIDMEMYNIKKDENLNSRAEKILK